MTTPKNQPPLARSSARTGGIPDTLDALIDATTIAATKKIRNMDRRTLELCLLNVVTSLDPRWKFPAKPITPPPLSEALIEVLFAVADALDAINQSSEEK